MKSVALARAAISAGSVRLGPVAPARRPADDRRAVHHDRDIVSGMSAPMPVGTTVVIGQAVLAREIEHRLDARGRDGGLEQRRQERAGEDASDGALAG